MTATQFAYWLQGFFELSETKELTEKQTEMIKNHLKLVFYYDIDPSYSNDPAVKKHMQDIHDGKSPEKKNINNPEYQLVRC